ncbi:MAG: type II toxin-antitoxin system death-on-curing family toxin [Candidatus Pacebacteria bacterium]|nr:type II toxin-antitoxin system death-on-curing family toxin [Candidatus Paceibacterota bacterium]
MSVKYLDIELMQSMCHRLALNIFDTEDDPIACFEEHTSLLESAINQPRQIFGGNELYPTLIEKAAILFYGINKNHPFRNGNKRISAASLIVFLYINDMQITASKSEIVDMTLCVAKSPTNEMHQILDDIKLWIGKHIEPLKANEPLNL